MTTNDFITAFEHIKGCSFATIEYLSTVRVPKKALVGVGYNHPADIVKKVLIGVQVGYSYKNAVNNRLEKCGEVADFPSASLPWGEWKVLNKTISHKGATYIRFYAYQGCPCQVEFARPYDMTLEQYLVAKDWIKNQPPKQSKKQSEYGLEENQVIARSVNVDNILAFKCGDVVYAK